jgi:hypothetical protein
LIGFEDLPADRADFDFQDVVLALTPVDDPTIGPITAEILSYQSSGYRFKIFDPGTPPPAGFARTDFDDTTWGAGSAAFGSGGVCAVQSTVQTKWPSQTELLVRRQITIPEGTTNVRIMVAVEDDIVEAFFNGTSIVGTRLHTGCPHQDNFLIEVPQALVQSGLNLIAAHLRNRDGESFFDARVLGEIPADSRATSEPVFFHRRVSVYYPILPPPEDVDVSCGEGPGAQPTTITFPVKVGFEEQHGEIFINPGDLSTTRH